MSDLVFTYNSTRTDCLSAEGVTTHETHEIKSDRGSIMVRLLLVNGKAETEVVALYSPKMNAMGECVNVPKIDPEGRVIARIRESR